MTIQLSAVQAAAPSEDPRAHPGTGGPEAMTPLALRVLGEYGEMPGLRLTVPQAARLFGITPDFAEAVLEELRDATILSRSQDGVFGLSLSLPAGRHTAGCVRPHAGR
jgi:hypothetical protein